MMHRLSMLYTACKTALCAACEATARYLRWLAVMPADAGEDDGEEEPDDQPRFFLRLGSVDEARHRYMTIRLARLMRTGTPLEQGDIDYWGARFCEYDLMGYAGCTFDAYLRRPEYWERIALARRALGAMRWQKPPRRIITRPLSLN